MKIQMSILIEVNIQLLLKPYLYNFVWDVCEINLLIQLRESIERMKNFQFNQSRLIEMKKIS